MKEAGEECHLNFQEVSQFAVLNTENPIWRTILTIGKHAFRNHSCNLPLPQGTEAQAAGQSRFRISTSHLRKWQLWRQHWQQRTPHQFSQQRNSENHRKPLIATRLKFPSDSYHSTTMLTSNCKPSHFRKSKLRVSSWMFITTNRKGRK